MNSQAEKLIEVAKSYVGYLEKASNAQLEDFTANAGSGNYTIFGRWYDAYYKTAGFNGAAWCHAFVSYCADRAGIGADIIPVTASCTTGVNWFRQRGLWHPRAGYEPQTGDIVYFTQDGVKPAHVGIVTGADGTMVYTIEGNTSGGSSLVSNGGGVYAKRYARASAYILGYGSPKYKQEDEMTQEQFEVMYNKVNPMIRTIDDVPPGLRAEVQKLLDAGVINGGTDKSVNARDINMRLDTLKAVVAARRP